jgi:hypothetical protein
MPPMYIRSPAIDATVPELRIHCRGRESRMMQYGH